MTDIHETWLARQRMRWVRPDAERYTRPDADRYMRPDAARFLRPDRNRFLRPEFQERKDARDSRHERQSTDSFEQLDEAARLQMRCELASLRLPHLWYEGSWIALAEFCAGSSTTQRTEPFWPPATTISPLHHVQ